ncbi:MAG: hypothetical protein KDD48_04115 [Bdellovibrionales bacterium]|nr:hypothetical protein [Bdellovibrionales bacterium]
MGQNRYFVLKGCAGLGNRLMTLSWAIHFCKQTNRILFVDWADGQFSIKGDNVFYNYFKLVNVSHVKSIEDCLDVVGSSCYPRIYQRNPLASIYDMYDGPVVTNRFERIRYKCEMLKFGTFLKGYWIQKNIDKEPNRLKTTIKNLFPYRFQKRIPIASDYSQNISDRSIFGADFLPMGFENNLKEHIDFTNSVREKLETEVKQLFGGNNVLGVHIRYTDLMPSVLLNKLHEYIARQSKNYQIIFLSTDSNEIEVQFKQRYKTIKVFSKYLPKTKGIGLHQWGLYQEPMQANLLFDESLRDLFALSRCDCLLFQSNSSFSRIARLLSASSQTQIDWMAL